MILDYIQLRTIGIHSFEIIIGVTAELTAGLETMARTSLEGEPSQQTTQNWAKVKEDYILLSGRGKMF